MVLQWSLFIIVVCGVISAIVFANVIEKGDYDSTPRRVNVTPQDIAVVLTAVLNTFNKNLSPHEIDCMRAAIDMYNSMIEGDEKDDNKRKLMQIYNIANGFAAICTDKKGLTESQINAAASAGVDKITKIIEDSNEI